MVSRILSHLRNVRQFTSPYAPNFFLFGGQVYGDLVGHLESPLYVMGKGKSFSVAQIRLCGEAVERVSILAKRANAVWAARNPLTEKTTKVIPHTFFPAGWRPQSHGCAAHNLWETAGLSAVEELWERRAVQEWWEGKCDLHVLRRDHPLFEEMTAHVMAWRQGAVESRETLFFVISGGYPVDVAIALSHDREIDQIAIAFSAGWGALGVVLRRAFEELLSVELEVADLFRARLDGDVIEEGTNRHFVQKRQRALRKKLPEMLGSAMPVESPRPNRAVSAGPDQLLKRSSDVGSEILLIDMTHEQIGLPSVRAIFSQADLNPFVGYAKDDLLPL